MVSFNSHLSQRHPRRLVRNQGFVGNWTMHTLLLLFVWSSTTSGFQLDCSAKRVGAPTPTAASIGNDESDSNMPTPAPSQAQPCDTQTSNARGTYSTTKAPCVFQFHAATVENAPTPLAERDFIGFRTSDLCTKENTIGSTLSSSSSSSSSSSFTVMEYVSQWPDECVGDFQRCYSLEYHTKIIEDFLCSKEWYSLPPGTTHISVDCTNDKERVDDAKRKEEVNRRKSQAQAVWHTYQMKFVNLVIIFTSCIAGLYIVSHWILKPLTTGYYNIGNEHGKHRKHLPSFSCPNDHYPSSSSSSSRLEASSIMMTSLRRSMASSTATTSTAPSTTNIASSTNSERCGLSIPSTWLRHGSHHRRNGSSGSYGSTDERNTDSNNASSTRTGSSSSSYMHGGNSNNNLRNNNNSNNNNDNNSRNANASSSHFFVVMDEDPTENFVDEEEEEFHRQIPADFDAVPIQLHRQSSGSTRTRGLRQGHDDVPFHRRQSQNYTTTTTTTSHPDYHHPLADNSNVIITSTEDDDELDYTTIPMVPATPLSNDSDPIVVHAEPSD